MKISETITDVEFNETRTRGAKELRRLWHLREKLRSGVELLIGRTTTGQELRLDQLRLFIISDPQRFARSPLAIEDDTLANLPPVIRMVEQFDVDPDILINYAKRLEEAK